MTHHLALNHGRLANCTGRSCSVSQGGNRTSWGCSGRRDGCLSCARLAATGGTICRLPCLSNVRSKPAALGATTATPSPPWPLARGASSGKPAGRHGARRCRYISKTMQGVKRLTLKLIEKAESHKLQLHKQATNLPNGARQCFVYLVKWREAVFCPIGQMARCMFLVNSAKWRT